MLFCMFFASFLKFLCVSLHVLRVVVSFSLRLLPFFMSVRGCCAGRGLVAETKTTVECKQARYQDAKNRKMQNQDANKCKIKTSRMQNFYFKDL